MNWKTKIIRIFFLFTSIIVSHTFFAQDRAKIEIDSTNNALNFNTCYLNPFVLDDGTLGVKYASSEGLLKYFKRKLNSSLVKEIKNGEILIQALIDKEGKICCKTVSSPTGLSTELMAKLKLNDIINEMPKWKTARMDGKKWNTSVFFSLVFSGNAHFKISQKRMSASLGSR